MSELPPFIEKNNYTKHHSITNTPIEASEKVNKKNKQVQSSRKERKSKPQFQLGQSVRTADKKISQNVIQQIGVIIDIQKLN